VLDLTKCDPALLQVPDAVVAALLSQSAGLRAQDVMIVGAHCRDILRSSLSQESGLRTTEDIDFGLALADWAAYAGLTSELEPTGNTGIRYKVADVATDLIPFGELERPAGTVDPPARHEPISVWGFTEVFEASRPLVLPRAGTIRIPTLAGYAALKLAAWLDRSAYGKYKDASDIATVLYWYSQSPAVFALLYETEDGIDILIQEDSDQSVAAARVLGQDIADVIGRERLAELTARWPGSRADSLYVGMTVTNAPRWSSSPTRRQELVRGMERGLGLGSAG
jgi:predicted nucleotidyltransferase